MQRPFSKAVFFLKKGAICNSIMDIEFSLAELEQLAGKLAQIIDGRKVVAIHGQMGAGKTTLISAICKALGSGDAIGSPTFSIINQYITPERKIIYHMDWYRIKDEQEAIEAGVEDALYSGNLCLVEWPEKAESLLPDNAMHVYIETIDRDTRRLFTTTSTG